MAGQAATTGIDDRRATPGGEFLRLIEDADETAEAPPPTAGTSIAPAGIHIHFPPETIIGYLGQLTEEIVLKADFLSAKRPVSHILLSGSPLSQLSAEQLTELVFRLCCRYRTLGRDRAERAIALTLAQCHNDNLALMRGLGFNWLDLQVTTGSGAGVPLEALQSALAGAGDYFPGQVRATLAISSRTRRPVLERLVDLFTRANALALRFTFAGTTATARRELEARNTLLSRLYAVLAERGYELLGDNYFARRDAPCLAWRATGQLRYGPWGFYNAAVSDWLGLGIGADSLVAGHLYCNTRDAETFRARVDAGRAPVVHHRDHLTDLRAYDFIQQLYCRHRFHPSLLREWPRELERWLRRGWVEKVGEEVRLTPSGTLHVPLLCRRYTRLCRRGLSPD